MARVLHLLQGTDPALALPVIDRQRKDPDATVTVVLLPGAVAPPLPQAVTVRRLDQDLGYSDLLDLIFDSDHVLTW